RRIHEDEPREPEVLHGAGRGADVPRAGRLDEDDPDPAQDPGRRVRRAGLGPGRPGRLPVRNLRAHPKMIAEAPRGFSRVCLGVGPSGNLLRTVRSCPIGVSSDRSRTMRALALLTLAAVPAFAQTQAFFQLSSGSFHEGKLAGTPAEPRLDTAIG